MRWRLESAADWETPGRIRTRARFGPFKVGTLYTAVTPCNSNSAPATCPAPGFAANYLGTINLKTGAISKVPTGGAKLNPKGMIYVP